MSFKQRVLYCFWGVRSLFKELSARKSASARDAFLAAELIRNTHSVEKGLCIENPRLGFGHKKQREMLNLIQRLKDSKSGYCREAVEMATDALRAYLKFHDEREYSDEFNVEMKAFLDREAPESAPSTSGGYLELNRADLTFDESEIERFIKSRHSIRDFADVDVDETTLRRALELAQYAPSACNRQGVRAYVMNATQTRALARDMEGIGGFAESVKRFVLITGKLTSYRIGEQRQYIVSASIYAAYLTLTLHLYGLGGCVVQRPLFWTKDWSKTRAELGIPEDEQLVCMLAVGALKETMRVPISHRLTNEEMIRFL